MPDFVRVRDKETGHHYSITRERYDRSPDLWQELKQPATHRNGDPLPAKHKTTVTAAVTEKKASHTAATSEKEN